MQPSYAFLEYSPQRGDISGFLYLFEVEKPKTFGRRLSLKKKGDGPDRYWFVLDGALLTWYTDVDGEEAGSIHFKDVEYVVSEDAVSDSNRIVLRKLDKVSINMVAVSIRPEIPDSVYAKSWLTALRKAKDRIGGGFGSSANTGMIF